MGSMAPWPVAVSECSRKAEGAGEVPMLAEPCCHASWSGVAGGQEQAWPGASEEWAMQSREPG